MQHDNSTHLSLCQATQKVSAKPSSSTAQSSIPSTYYVTTPAHPSSSWTPVKQGTLMALKPCRIEAYSAGDCCCTCSCLYDRYLAGWGYLLSQDAVQLIVDKVDTYEQQPEQAPGWFAGLHWEDVLVGLLLHEYAEPQNRPDGIAFLSSSVILCRACSRCTGGHRHMQWEQITPGCLQYSLLLWTAVI